MGRELDLLNGSAIEVAQRLIGCVLERELDGQLVCVRIIETEAYDQHDAASHSYKGWTPRTEVMFGPAGHLYVYFTYGMHYCCNIVVGEEGYGAAVLVRAVEPLTGEAVLMARRHGHSGKDLTNGPAKLCQALGIDMALNGHELQSMPLRLRTCAPLSSTAIIQSTRIGISHAKDKPWRFFEKGNRYVSKK